MSDGQDSQPATAYVPQEQYARWKGEANARDMSISEFIAGMTEAGLKKFDRHVTRDETARDLREQRNDLKRELDRARERISRFENRVHRGERAAITEFVTEHPGATYDEIVQHLMNTLPKRANRHLTDLEGETVRVEGERFYPTLSDDNQSLADEHGNGEESR